MTISLVTVTTVIVEVKFHIVVVTVEIVTTRILVCWVYFQKTVCEATQLFSPVHNIAKLPRINALKITFIFVFNFFYVWKILHFFAKILRLDCSNRLLWNRILKKIICQLKMKVVTLLDPFRPICHWHDAFVWVSIANNKSGCTGMKPWRSYMSTRSYCSHWFAYQLSIECDFAYIRTHY